MLKVNNKDTRRRSGVFIVNFEHILHFALVFLLLTLNMQLAIASWVSTVFFLESCELFMNSYCVGLLRTAAFVTG